MGNIALERAHICTKYGNGPYKSVRKKDQTLPPAQTLRLLYVSWVAGDEIFETLGGEEIQCNSCKGFW